VYFIGSYCIKYITVHGAKNIIKRISILSSLCYCKYLLADLNTYEDYASQCQ